MCAQAPLRKGWILPAEYYAKTLYPLQDTVIQVFRNTPFYLSGGTALSRGYYNHRFSDDLDYFVNDHPDFLRIADRAITSLRNLFSAVHIVNRDRHFCRLFVGEENLKIELINDVPSHIGALVEHPVLGIIDSRENILANKITALADRALPKDVVDIFFLLKDNLDIKKAFTDAESKAAGISPLLIAKILSEFDYTIIDDQIKWVSPIDTKIIRDYMTNLVMFIVKGTL